MNNALFALSMVPWALASCVIALTLVLINMAAEFLLPEVFLEFAQGALESAFQRMADRGI